VLTGKNRRSIRNSAILLFLIFSAQVVLHVRLLKLPYFWDEAGYYIPAAHDLFLSGSLIPHTTVSNAHPPAVMAYLALCWKIFGFAPYITRLAMLLISAYALLGLFRLARAVANLEVAVAAVVCTALYPVFFAQSTLAHLDLAAAGFIFWGLTAYAQKRGLPTAVYFSLAVLTKETALLAPFALAGWEILKALRMQRSSDQTKISLRILAALFFPALLLALWYGYHYHRTGFVFGNPEFLRYNVEATLHPLRILLAMVMRLWQTFGYMNLLLLTASGVIAMWLPPLVDHGEERPRIALDVQFAFLALAGTQVIAMGVVGGAELARYMLPVVPLVILVFVSTVWRRVKLWGWVLGLVLAGFVFGIFINPPYVFAPEDNLAYRDFVQLHQDAERFLESRYPRATVLTAWPASDELTRPFLGYVTRPIRVVRIEDFRLEQVVSAADARSSFNLALVFSTKYDPPRPLLPKWPAWERLKTRFFDSHQDISPAVAAQILGGEIVFSERRTGQWAAVIEIKQVMEARVWASSASGGRNVSSQSTTLAAQAEDAMHHGLPR
jgi:hypothetical protein